MRRAPSWICGVPVENMEMTAVGTSPKSKAGVAFMEKMAATDARVNLAKMMHGGVVQNIANYGDTKRTDSKEGVMNSQSGVLPQHAIPRDLDNALVSKVTNETLEGTKIIRKIFGPKGRLYVLIGLNEVNTNALYKSIAEEYRVQRTK